MALNLAHPSKDKGDKGLAFVIAALLTKDIKVALPVSEHLPFDLIAINNAGQLSKVSVKWRAAEKGRIELLLRHQWRNKSGLQHRPMAQGEVDAHAIYCPDTGKCYFVKDEDVNGTTITLRIDPPKRKGKSIRLAEDYLDPEVIFP